jgi:NADPH:quinone reductase-like Zn-dependent oxidoreductase
MGIIDDKNAVGRGLGYEGVGTITKVGASVRGLCKGDRVYCISTGSFATSMILKEKLCVKVPEGLSLEDAATMPCVYSTVIYCLQHAANITKDKVRMILNYKNTVLTYSDGFNPFCCRCCRNSCCTDCTNGPSKSK